MAARKGELTDAKILAARPRAARYELSPNRGLRLWVYPSGRKTWVMSYRIGDERVRLTLGEYGTGLGAFTLAAARVEFDRRRREADQAREGLGPAPKQAAAVARAERLAEPTVSELAERWLAAPGKRGPKAPGTVTEYRRMLDRDVIPHIGTLRAAHVTDKHLRSVLDKIADRGKPVAVSETFKLLRAMFRFALDRGTLEHSPAERLRIAPAERKKSRVLTDAELRALFALMRSDRTRVGESTALCLYWVLLTACRPGEARGALWSEVDQAAGTWTITGSRTKNGRAHVVALSAAALAALEQARELADEHPYLFPGTSEDAPLTDQALSHAVRRMRDRLKTAGVVEPFTPHDLRRTAATIVAGKLGFGRFIASLLLGHVSETEGSVTAIYDRHGYEPEKARAWEALGEYASALRAGDVPKVRALADARKAAQ